MILPTKEILDAYDMSCIEGLFKNVPERKYLSDPAGQEHYRLLRWFSESSNYKRFAEVGVYMGLGAASLAKNQTNIVDCYDTNYNVLNWKNTPMNCNLYTVNSEHDFPPQIINADLILIDTWHNGIMERDIYNFLSQSKWRGILIYDDIHWNEPMQAFWDSLPSDKIDATEIGHSTGTGILIL